MVDKPFEEERSEEALAKSFALWAKAKDSEWHALPYHLLDVGAAATALWLRQPDAVRQFAERCFGGAPGASTTVIFLAAAHDIGKANRFFQAKAKGQRQRLIDAGFDIPPPELPEPDPHGQASGAYLQGWLTSRWGWNTSSALNTALAVGGHHGRFFKDTHCSPLGVQKEPWSLVGQVLLDEIAVTVGAGPSSGGGRPPTAEMLNPFLAWLAGFVSVADWLGSNERMVGWVSGQSDLAAYWASAQLTAEQLLDWLGWSLPKASPLLSLGEIVPKGRTPNALQSCASTAAADFSFAIVEAPTGEGKTEAAFALLDPSRGAGRGAYFALPTMATANGLYERVFSYLRRASNDPKLETRLLHSQAWLFKEDPQAAQDPGDKDYRQETSAQDWFAGSKRGLLAPYAVGTIDQALMGVLCAKHGFVRLFSLAGKTVVIDEVHAYDVYMASLLDTLLGWLKALDCKVILLSATLPSKRRAALLRAWGADHADKCENYPCINYVGLSGGVKALPFDVAQRKPLRITPLIHDGQEKWLAGATRILERVRDEGGFGALILNTVGDAQAAFRLLSQEVGGSVHVDLFHARFTAQDRDEIEKRVLSCFGRNAPRNEARIIVGTQVIEQSLDLDFDHMVSSLAPIDLLIQRAGRLHRHNRFRDGSLRSDGGMDERSDSILEVIMPALDDNGIPNRLEPVYSQMVLARTAGYLAEPLTISSPNDVTRAIEAVYADSEREQALAEQSGRFAAYVRAAAILEAKQASLAEHATIAAVDDPDTRIVRAFLELDEHDDREGSALAAKTRLEDRPSVTLVLLSPDGKTIHSGEPTEARQASFAAVRCSPPFELWREIIDLPREPAWRGKGMLASAKPFRMDHGRLGSFSVEYDSRIGLVWKKCDVDIST